MRWFCTLHLAVNFMFVPLVRNRFAHTLHPAALAFVSYGIVLVQVQVQAWQERGLNMGQGQGLVTIKKTEE